MMSAKYFEYYTIMLGGGRFFPGHAVFHEIGMQIFCW